MQKLRNIQTIAPFAPFLIFMRLHLLKFAFKLSLTNLKHIIEHDSMWKWDNVASIFGRKLIEEKFCIAVKGPHKGCLRDESYSGVSYFTFSHTKYPQFVTQKTWYLHIFSDVWIFRFSFQKLSGINRGEGGLGSG